MASLLLLVTVLLGVFAVTTLRRIVVLARIISQFMPYRLQEAFVFIVA